MTPQKFIQLLRKEVSTYLPRRRPYREPPRNGRGAGVQF